MGETSGAASPALVERTADWLMAQALKDADLKDIVRGCCERLHGAGVPIARVQCSFTLLHPLYRGIGVTLGVFRQQLVGDDLAVWRAGHDIGKGPAAIDPKLPTAVRGHIFARIPVSNRH